MRRRGVVVLFLTVLLLGFSTALAAELDFADRPGTIAYTLSLPIGSAVYLDAVYVDAISQDYLVIREWSNPRRTIVVSMIPPPALTLDQLVDVEGVLGRLADGSPAILNPHVYGYLDEQGNLDRDPFVIKMFDEHIPWPFGLVDMSTIVPDESEASRMPGMESMETLTLIEGTIGWAKQQDDTVSIDLYGKEVTAGTNQFDGCIYIEEADRSSGIKVATTGSFEPGDIVDVTDGTMAEWNGEYYIADAAVEEVDTADLLSPMFLINRNLSGKDFGYQLGMLQGFGPSTIGLFVTCLGRVTAVYSEEKCFYIDDGSGLKDQTHGQLKGIKVSWDGQAAGSTTIVPPALCSMVIVTGISTTEMPEEARIPVLRPRDQLDIGEYPDTTPPNPGVATSPPHTTTSPITVTYSGASDDISGLNHVELWYKKGITTTWADSGLSSTTSSGSFSFALEDGEGIYYFDLVAEDNIGRRSPLPSADDPGDCNTIYDTSLSASGRAFLYTEYLYPGGPVMRTSAHAEEGAEVRATARAYGPAGELLGISGSTDTASYLYDSLYRVIGLTDGRGKTTNLVYDDDGDPNTEDPKIGVLTRVEYPGGEVVSFPEHDPEGRVLKRIDLDGQRTTTYQYFDPEGLLTEIAYPTRTELFQYDDPYGRLTQVDDGSGSRSYTYDNLDAVTGVSTTYTGLTGSGDVGYEYYPDGSLQALTTPAGDFEYEYDAMGRPVQLTNPYSQVFSWYYLDNDWLETQTTPVATTSYDYNARGFLTSLVNRKPDETLLSEFTMPSDTGYDAVGNVLSLTANLPNVGSEFSGITTYLYDTRDQLTLEQSSRNGTEGYENSFVYDSAGNSTTLRNTSGREFNDNNQNTAYTYDDNGNPTVYKGAAPLTYDEEDRLTDYAGDMSAGYTSDGLRAWKQVGSARIYYIYSGSTPIFEIDGTTGSITAINTFGPTGLLARRQDSQDTFYTFDPQGNVSQAQDTTGQVTSTQLYDAYGALLSGDADPPYGFGAQHSYCTDPETGLLLLTHRYYDPEEGRFLTRDPIGYSGGTNLYGYAQGNPVNATDPLGLCDERPWWQKLADGYYYGTGYGESARDYYAEQSLKHPWNPLNYIGGVGASLWTRETWKATAITLATAGSLKIGPSPAEPVHIGLDLPGDLNLIHYGEHAWQGRHIGLLFKGPYRALFHIKF